MYLRIASGIGGGVGKWAPTGLNPFSSAIYCKLIRWPSGAVYENDPSACWDPSGPGPGFKKPLSCAAMPFPVS